LKPTSFFTSRRFDLLGIILLIALLLAIVFAWPAPAAGAYLAQAATPTLVETQPSPTPTLIPKEYLESTDQTNGIICGSVVLVLIIIGGTLGILRSKNRTSQ
jgi:hypothetical protein